jgi:hypothetical protein
LNDFNGALAIERLERAQSRGRHRPIRLSPFSPFAGALMTHPVGCARRFPAPEVTRIKAVTPADLKQYLLSRKLAAAGSIDYAWSGFENGFENGTLFNARRN